MADTVRLTLSAHHAGKKPGDEIDADTATAKRLIGGGIARPATVPEAKKAGVDKDMAATKQD